MSIDMLLLTGWVRQHLSCSFLKLCVFTSHSKRVWRVVRLLQEVGWRQTGPYGRSYESRERGEHWDQLASLSLGWNKERIEKAGQSTEVNGWAELCKTLKWTRGLSTQVPMQMEYCVLSSQPGSFQAALFLTLWTTDYCINSLQTSVLRCIFTTDGQNASLKIQLWNCTWYLCLYPPMWIARLGKVIGSCCAMKVKDKAFKHKCGMEFCLYSKGEIQQAMLVD